MLETKAGTIADASAVKSDATICSSPTKVIQAALPLSPPSAPPLTASSSPSPVVLGCNNVEENLSVDGNKTSANATEESSISTATTATEDEDRIAIAETSKVATSSIASAATTATEEPVFEHAFYGDLIIGLTFCVVTPLYGWKAIFVLDSTDPQKTVALIMVLSDLCLCILSFASYLRHCEWYSRLAFVSGLWMASFTNWAQWPYVPFSGHYITTVFQGLLFAILGNSCLPVQDKLQRLLIVFVVGSIVAICNPHSHYLEDTFWSLGGSVLLTVILLLAWGQYFNNNRQQSVDWVLVKGARLVLAAIFLFHTANDLISISTNSSLDPVHTYKYAHAGNFAVVKAGCVAIVGLAATGAFGKQINIKEHLEVLVQQRTKEIQQQSDKLREKTDKLYMVNLALQASETAIAITDSDRFIIWSNAAFERICHNSNGKPRENDSNDTNYCSNHKLTDVLALDSSDVDNMRKLKDAFDGRTTNSSTREEEEIFINEMIFNLEVSPFPDRTSSFKGSGEDKFIVVFKNITVDRARQVAEQTAQEEAMLAKAMGDSMVTLTHELRTPLQGIMGVTSVLLASTDDENGQHHDDEGCCCCDCKGSVSNSNNDNSNKVLSKNMIDSLKLIMASSVVLLNLINNLLDVKKATAKMMDTFPLSSVVASVIIKDAVDFCQPLASISNVKVSTDFSGSSLNAMVTSNALRLQQVLINLVSNAIKYTFEQSEICISIREATLAEVENIMNESIASSRDKDNDSIDNIRSIKQDRKVLCSSYSPNNKNTPVLVFSVSDCGPGIALRQAHRLFRRFARLDCSPRRSVGGSSNTVGQPTGTGLGLHLCLLFVQRMNGHIWASNNNSKNGATFSFCLPLVVPDSSITHQQRHPPGIKSLRSRVSETYTRNPYQQGGITMVEENEDEQSVYDFRENRLLVVDDVLVNLKVLSRMVKNIGIKSVTTVNSGHKALTELFENGPYDIVITDLQMPGMSGNELSKAITKADLSYPRPVVVGLTADTSVNVTTNCATSGMSDVLYKPITVSEMREYFATTMGRLQPGTWHHPSNDDNPPANALPEVPPRLFLGHRNSPE